MEPEKFIEDQLAQKRPVKISAENVAVWHKQGVYHDKVAKAGVRTMVLQDGELWFPPEQLDAVLAEKDKHPTESAWVGAMTGWDPLGIDKRADATTAVEERTPDNTVVRATGVPEQLVPQAQAAMEAQKDPANTVTVQPVESHNEERAQAVAAEQQGRTPPVAPTVPKRKSKVLEAVERKAPVVPTVPKRAAVDAEELAGNRLTPPEVPAVRNQPSRMQALGVDEKNLTLVSAVEKLERLSQERPTTGKNAKSGNPIRLHTLERWARTDSRLSLTEQERAELQAATGAKSPGEAVKLFASQLRELDEPGKVKREVETLLAQEDLTTLDVQAKLDEVRKERPSAKAELQQLRVKLKELKAVEAEETVTPEPRSNSAPLTFDDELMAYEEPTYGSRDERQLYTTPEEQRREARNLREILRETRNQGMQQELSAREDDTAEVNDGLQSVGNDMLAEFTIDATGKKVAKDAEAAPYSRDNEEKMLNFYQTANPEYEVEPVVVDHPEDGADMGVVFKFTLRNIDDSEQMDEHATGETVSPESWTDQAIRRSHKFAKDKITKGTNWWKKRVGTFRRFVVEEDANGNVTVAKDEKGNSLRSDYELVASDIYEIGYRRLLQERGLSKRDQMRDDLQINVDEAWNAGLAYLITEKFPVRKDEGGPLKKGVKRYVLYRMPENWKVGPVVGKAKSKDAVWDAEHSFSSGKSPQLSLPKGLVMYRSPGGRMVTAGKIYDPHALNPDLRAARRQSKKISDDIAKVESQIHEAYNTLEQEVGTLPQGKPPGGKRPQLEGRIDPEFSALVRRREELASELAAAQEQAEAVESWPENRGPKKDPSAPEPTSPKPVDQVKRGNPEAETKVRLLKTQIKKADGDLQKWYEARQQAEAAIAAEQLPKGSVAQMRSPEKKVRPATGPFETATKTIERLEKQRNGLISKLIRANKKIRGIRDALEASTPPEKVAFISSVPRQRRAIGARSQTEKAKLRAAERALEDVVENTAQRLEVAWARVKHLQELLAKAKTQKQEDAISQMIEDEQIRIAELNMAKIHAESELFMEIAEQDGVPAALYDEYGPRRLELPDTADESRLRAQRNIEERQQTGQETGEARASDRADAAKAEAAANAKSISPREWRKGKAQTKIRVHFPVFAGGKVVKNLRIGQQRANDAFVESLTGLLGKFVSKFKLPVNLYVSNDLEALPEQVKRLGDATAEKYFRLMGEHFTRNPDSKGFVFHSGNDAFIWISPKVTSRMDQMSVLTHELGHVITRHYWHMLSPELKKQLHAEHAGAKQEAQFAEWLANQFKKWAEKPESEARTWMEKFFHRVAVALKQAWSFFTGEYKLNETFDKWMEGLSAALAGKEMKVVNEFFDWFNDGFNSRWAAGYPDAEVVTFGDPSLGPVEHEQIVRTFSKTVNGVRMPTPDLRWQAGLFLEQLNKNRSVATQHGQNLAAGEYNLNWQYEMREMSNGDIVIVGKDGTQQQAKWSKARSNQRIIAMKKLQKQFPDAEVVFDEATGLIQVRRPLADPKLFGHVAPRDGDPAAVRAFKPVFNSVKETHDKLKGKSEPYKVLSEGTDALLSRLFKSVATRVANMEIPAFSELMSKFHMDPGVLGVDAKGRKDSIGYQRRRQRDMIALNRELRTRLAPLWKYVNDPNSGFIADKEVVFKKKAYAGTQLFKHTEEGLRVLQQYAERHGLKWEKEAMAGYFPIAINWEWVDNNREEITKSLIKASMEDGLTEGEAVARARNTLTQMHNAPLNMPIAGTESLNDAFARAPQLAESLVNRVLTQREIDALHEHGALQTDPAEAFRRLTWKLVDMAVFNYYLGDMDWADSNPDGTPDYGKTLRNLFERATSEGATEDQQAFAWDALAIMLGRYKLQQSMALNTLFDSVLLFQSMRTLTFTLFASFPDLTVPLIRYADTGLWSHGVKNYLWEALKGKGDGYEMVRAMGLLQLHSDEYWSFELAQYDPAKFIKKTSHKFFRAIQMERWSNAMRAMSAAMGRDWLVKHAGTYETNPDSKRYLDELGLKPEDVFYWRDQKFAMYGQGMFSFERFHSMEAEIRKRPAGWYEEMADRFPNEERTIYKDGNEEADEWKASIEKIDRATSAMARLVDETSLHANPAEKTAWGNDPVWKLLWHLKSFMYAYYQKVMRRAWHEYKARGSIPPAYYAAFAFAMGLAAFGMVLRDMIQYRLWGREGWVERMAPGEFVWQTFIRTGFLGPAQLLADVRDASERGRAPVLALMGPSVTWVNDLFQYPAYKTVPSSVPVAAQLPFIRDPMREWIKETFYD